MEDRLELNSYSLITPVPGNLKRAAIPGRAEVFGGILRDLPGVWNIYVFPAIWNLGGFVPLVFLPDTVRIQAKLPHPIQRHTLRMRTAGVERSFGLGVDCRFCEWRTQRNRRCCL